MYDLVLKNGLVYIDNYFRNLDLAINGEKIACLGKDLKGKKEIEIVEEEEGQLRMRKSEWRMR